MMAVDDNELKVAYRAARTLLGEGDAVHLHNGRLHGATRGSSDIPPVRLEPSKQHKDDDNDQDGADKANTAVTIPVAVSRRSGH